MEMIAMPLYSGMAISISDLPYVYSGGSSNSNPTLSLGGLPSDQIIPDPINNLFADISATEAKSGRTDYRCFYIFNDSEDTELHDSILLVSYQVEDGATANLGFCSRNDHQAITVEGDPTSGTMTLLCDGFQFVVPYDADHDQFAANVAEAMNASMPISGIRCTGFQDNGAVTVLVYFEGENSNRYYPPISVLSNEIDGASTIVVTKIADGSPLNSVAATIGTPTAEPPGVLFNNYVGDNPYSIGRFLPGDGIPVWVRRTTPVNAIGIRNDGFTCRIAGRPIPYTPPAPPPTYSYIGNGIITMGGASDVVDFGSAYFAFGSSGGVEMAGDADYLVTGPGGLPAFYITPSGGIFMDGSAAIAPRSLYSYTSGTPNASQMTDCTIPGDITTLTLTDQFGEVTLTRDIDDHFVGCALRQIAANDVASSYVTAPVRYTLFCSPSHWLDPTKNLTDYPPPPERSYPVEWRLRIGYPTSFSLPPGSLGGALPGYTCGTIDTAPKVTDVLSSTDIIDALYSPGAASLPVDFTLFRQATGYWIDVAYVHLYVNPGGLMRIPDPGFVITQPGSSYAGISMGGSAVASHS